MDNHEYGPSAPRVGWFKSSYTQKNGCVEVKFDGDSVLVRDTKYLRNPANDPAENPVITIPLIKWTGFLENALDSETASRGTKRDQIGLPAIERDPAGGATLRAADGTTLVYNQLEWTAFLNGVRDGEFSLLAA